MFNDDKWNTIHGPLKNIIKGTLISMGYVMNKHIIKEKSELKSHSLKRLWACWEIAFDRWEKELGIDYRKTDTYRILERGRNIAFTVIDNDGAYVKLLYQMMRAWEDVKEDDKYLE